MSFSLGTFTINSVGNPVVTGTTISSSWANALTADLATGLSTCVLKDGTQTITADIPMASHKLTGLAAGSAAGNSVRYEQSVVGISGAAQGKSVISDSSQFSTNGFGWGYPAMRSYLAGCTLSTVGSSATMSIAAGQAVDSTNLAMMTLAAISKTTAAWAVGTGNGGKMSAAALAAGTYHFHLIMRVDTGVVDVGFDTSATSPTLPTSYTLFRRIGSAKNDGTNWIAFVQNGDLFEWLAPVADVSSANNPGVSAVTRTLTVPTGIIVTAIYGVAITGNTGTGGHVYMSDLATTDTAAGVGATQLGWTASTNTNAASMVQTPTNISAQVRSRLNASDASVNFSINTQGWIDRRGRDS